jgi:hypothetical protein
LKNVLRAALVASALAAMAGCTGANQLLAAIPTGSASPSGTTPTTASSTTPSTTSSPSTSTTPKPTASTDLSNTTAAQCTRTSPSGEPDLLSGTAYGKFNGQHVPNGWAKAYDTEKKVWDAINSNSSVAPADWACFQKFYPGATQVWKDLSDTYGS